MSSTLTPAPVHEDELPDVEALRARTAGTVAVPGDASYDQLVTPWNLAVEVRPRLVVAARTAQDVVETVRYARAHGLTLSPQATGHGAQHGAAGDIVINTRGLDECSVSPAGSARVGAGVKWLRVVQEAAPHGLAPVSGSSTDVGVVGYLTGGGLGPMVRTYGVSADRVTAFEVVTGDGELRRATPAEHPELFFGLRGGKGAVGIVTAVELELVAQPRFYGGALFFAGEHAPAVVEVWRAWAAELPEAGTTSIAVLNLPPIPGVPEPLAGRTTLAVRVLWTGDEETGAALVAPLRAAAPVLLDGVRELPYAAVDAVHTDPVDPMPATEVGASLTAFPAEAAEALLDLTLVDSPLVVAEVRQLGGAMTRPAAHPGAFDGRDVGWSLLCIGLPVVPGADEHARAVVAALAPWTASRRLANWTSTPAQLVECFAAPTLVALRDAVRRYDPDGVIAVGRALTA